MKKEKVLALLLTASMCTVAVPAYAADFADDATEMTAVSAADTAETDAEDADVQSEETEPEILTEEASEEYEQDQDAAETEAFQAADAQAVDFADAITEEDTDAAGTVGYTTIARNDASVSGNTPTATSPKYYRVSLPEGGRLSLKGTSNGGDFYLNVLNMDEEKVAGFYINYTDDRTYNYDCHLVKGDYLIKIYSSIYHGGVYTLRTKFKANAGLSFPENSNDDFATASTISVGQVIKGHLACNNRNDYYKVKIPSDGEYTFITKNVDGNAFKQYLYDQNWQSVSSFYVYAQSSNEKKMELKKGTYYYRVTDEGYNDQEGNYWFKIVGHTHSYKTTYTYKATPYRNGSVTKKCSGCGNTITETVYRPETVKLSSRSYVYNGKSHKPSVTVIASNGKALSTSSYTVSYEKDTVSAGRHKVKITLKGRYSGEMAKYYVINPKATYIKSTSRLKKGFQVNIKAQSSKNVTGYQVQYSTDPNFSAAKTRNTTSTSLKITGLKSNKNYYVRVRVYRKSAKTYYSSWSGVTKIKTK